MKDGLNVPLLQLARTWMSSQLLPEVIGPSVDADIRVLPKNAMPCVEAGQFLIFYLPLARSTNSLLLLLSFGSK